MRNALVGAGGIAWGRAGTHGLRMCKTLNSIPMTANPKREKMQTN